MHVWWSFAFDFHFWMILMRDFLEIYMIPSGNWSTKTGLRSFGHKKFFLVFEMRSSKSPNHQDLRERRWKNNEKNLEVEWIKEANVDVSGLESCNVHWIAYCLHLPFKYLIKNTNCFVCLQLSLLFEWSKDRRSWFYCGFEVKKQSKLWNILISKLCFWKKSVSWRWMCKTIHGFLCKTIYCYILPYRVV